MIKAKLNWEGDLAFKVEHDGKSYYVDGDPEYGGKDLGVRPKTLLLSALGGCSGMDAVSILKKMRLPEYKLTIDLESTVADEHPAVLEEISLSFKFSGEDLPVGKLKRAVELSTEKYCPVYAMLLKSAKINTKTYLNGEEI
jgi:putative redox protein